jgi:Domain of unknown function (DUF4260)
LPDVALFVGIGMNLDRDQLHPRAVPLYSALHRFGGPVLLGLSAYWAGAPWLVAALAWAAHIAFDRALGYGLRGRAGLASRARRADASVRPASRLSQLHERYDTTLRSSS